MPDSSANKQALTLYPLSHLAQEEQPVSNNAPAVSVLGRRLQPPVFHQVAGGYTLSAILDKGLANVSEVKPKRSQGCFVQCCNEEFAFWIWQKNSFLCKLVCFCVCLSIPWPSPHFVCLFMSTGRCRCFLLMFQSFLASFSSSGMFWTERVCPSSAEFCTQK